MKYINSPWIDYYNHPDLIESCEFGAFNGIDFKSKCFKGHLFNEQCKFEVEYWKRIRIICKHRLKLFDYPILQCIVHNVKGIDLYYGVKSKVLYLHHHDWNPTIYFYTFKTNKNKKKRNVRHDQSYKIEITMLSFLFKQRASGHSIVEIMDTINTLYSSTMQTIRRNLYNETSNIIDLELEFAGKSKNGAKYISNALLNRVTLDLILKDLQRGYSRAKWEQFQGIYHQRPVEEFAFDATFAICSKLFYIKNKKWHLLKVSFGHLEDDIGLTPDGLILINAAESHDKLVEFFTSFIVLNIVNCRDEHRSYIFKIGTDNSGRDVNIGEKILNAIKTKLKLDEVYNPIHRNHHGVIFDIRRLEIIVTFIPINIYLYILLYISVVQFLPLILLSLCTYLFLYTFYYKNDTYLYVYNIKIVIKR